jgi:hypothetical protein
VLPRLFSNSFGSSDLTTQPSLVAEATSMCQCLTFTSCLFHVTFIISSLLTVFGLVSDKFCSAFKGIAQLSTSTSLIQNFSDSVYESTQPAIFM